MMASGLTQRLAIAVAISACLWGLILLAMKA